MATANGPPGLPPGLTITIRDVRPLYEAFEEEDDENGNPIFVYTGFGYVTEDFHVYFGTSKLRKLLLTPEHILENLKPLTDDGVYPFAPSDVTVFPGSFDASTHYLKSPRLSDAYIGTDVLPQLLLAEARTMELLKKHPHPHLVPYYGCLIKRDRIVGLVLSRYVDTLSQRLEFRPDQAFDSDKCMESVKSAVQHLHSLGLAHNDLNPANIMVDESDNTFLIDLGSSMPFGGTLISAGTPGWADEDLSISARKNDEIALENIRIWLVSQPACQDISKD